MLSIFVWILLGPSSTDDDSSSVHHNNNNNNNNVNVNSKLFRDIGYKTIVLP